MFVLYFYLFVGATCKEFFFIKLHGYKLTSSEYTTREINGALQTCAVVSCIGLRKVNETSFTILISPLINASKDEWCIDYLMDLSNGTEFKSAPSILHSKLIFGIYNAWGSMPRNCPSYMNEINGRCERKVGEEICKGYPSYMESSYNATSGMCSALLYRDIIKTWN